MATTARQVRLILGAALLVAPGAASQDPPQDRPQELSPITRTPPPETRRLFDRVIGVFGDKAILESSIYSELQAWIEGEKNAGRHLTAAQIRRRRSDILRQRLQDEALAQGARTLRGTTREQMDHIVDQYVDDFVREKEESAGSVNKLTEELGILGQTWESVAEERRTEVMAQIATRQNLTRRWHDHFALAVTPTEIRRFYDENRRHFVQEPSADIEVIAIPGATDPEAALGQATKAAEAWRQGQRAAADIAAEFGGVRLDPRERVRDAEDDQNAPPIKEFAARAQEGEVSEPIPRGSSYWILKATAVHAGRSESFEDPKIQAFIHRHLVNERIERERTRLILKNGQKFRPLTPRGRPR